jgi:hypothetical protein
MCLTCGCMQAHLEMGEHNIDFDDVVRAAEENGRTVAETLEIMARTADGSGRSPGRVRDRVTRAGADRSAVAPCVGPWFPARGHSSPTSRPWT